MKKREKKCCFNFTHSKKKLIDIQIRKKPQKNEIKNKSANYVNNNSSVIVFNSFKQLKV
jgi:hypothetical protein